MHLYIQMMCLRTKQFAMNIKLHDSTKNMDLKINVSMPKTIIFDREKGVQYLYITHKGQNILQQVTEVL